MHTPRGISYTMMMLSQASQLPQGVAVNRQACICPNFPDWKSANAC